MRDRVDFSRNAGVYDSRHGAVLSTEVVRQLATAAALRPGQRILDIGSGTGRVAIPMAHIGCDVVALEPASAVAAALRTKAATRVHVVAADGGQLPFQSSRFDVVIFARVLYLIPDWRAAVREGYRVLRPGGRILHDWGNGQPDEEWVQNS